MPLSRSTLGAGVGLALLCMAGRAHAAEGPPANDAKPAGERRWDASVRAGYGTVFTEGISYLGVGVGAALGRRVGAHLRLELVGLASFGSSERASNATITYRAEYSSFQLSAGAAYEIRLAAISLRPGFRAGGSLIEGHTRIGSVALHDLHMGAILGPSLAALAHIAKMELGFAGEAFFLPTRPAAPTAGVYAIAGVAF